MNQKVKIGNIYRTPSGAVYVVREVGIRTVTAKNVRTGAEYIVRHAALALSYELIGIPYNQEPVNETDLVHGK